MGAIKRYVENVDILLEQVDKLNDFMENTPELETAEFTEEFAELLINIIAASEMVKDCIKE